MRWFEDTVRLFLVLSVIMTSGFYNFDFKIPLIILSLVYFFQSIILYPVIKGNLLRYLIYIIDAGFILYLIYITDQIYLSIFWFLLIAKIKSKLEMAINLVPSAVITGFSFYKSGFYDFNLVFLSIASVVVILNFIFEHQKGDKELKNLVEITKNLYRDNLICNDRKEFFERYYNLKEAVKNLKDGKVELENFCDIVFNNLNCDTVVVMDIFADKICHKGKFNIEEDVLNYIKDENMEGIRKTLDVKFVIIKNINKVKLVLAYKDYVLIDKDLIDAIS